jgi:hypothetical protein
MATSLIARDAACTFVSVAVFEALVVPWARFPNPSVAGVRVTGTTPVPVIATLCGLVVALSATVSVAVSAPRIEGVKVMVMLQLFPAASVAGLKGQFPPATKSPAFAPLNVMLLMVSATVWVFLNVAVFAALAWSMTSLPNESVAGVRVVCAKAAAPNRRGHRSIVVRLHQDKPVPAVGAESLVVATDGDNDRLDLAANPAHKRLVNFTNPSSSRSRACAYAERLSILFLVAF